MIAIVVQKVTVRLSEGGEPKWLVSMPSHEGRPLELRLTDTTLRSFVCAGNAAMMAAALTEDDDAGAGVDVEDPTT